MKRLLAILACVLCLGNAVAQNAPFRHYFRCYTKKDGLSQTDVKAILQDSYGFMWFGTRNKLNRYDGNTIRVFDCVDSESGMRDNNVSSLYEDSSRRLWIGTDNGVFIFDPVTEVFDYIDDAAADGVRMTDWVSAIKSDSAGNVWIVLPNQGLFRRDPAGKLWHYTFGNPDVPDHGSPQCLCIDSGSRVWIGTNGLGVYLYDANADRFSQYLGDSAGSTLEGENIYKMCDYGEDLVIGIHEGKLRRLNKRRNVVSDFNVPEVHYKIIRDVAAMDNELWVATQAGAYIINESEGTVEHIYNDPMCNYSLSDNQISYIYRDKENGIWLGTNMGGVNYLPRYGMEFIRHVPMSRDFSISSKRIREMVQDSHGNVWIGTEDKGVNIYDPDTGLCRRLGKDTGSHPASDRTMALLAMNDDVWVGYFKDGLDITSGNGRNISHYTEDRLSLSEGSIYAMCRDRSGNVWLGNGWGVYLCDPVTMRMEHKPEFGMNYIFDILESSDGKIWVATMGSGVFRYDPATGAINHFEHDENDSSTLSSNSVSGIFESSQGEIWFSTDRGGICRYNAAENNFTTVSAAQGLPDDTAYKILEDKNHNLWFGTNNGLVQFTPTDLKIKTFTTKDGLPSNQFNYKSALVGSDGTFYFGSSEGLVSFDPYHHLSNTYVPPVYITKLVIDGTEKYVVEDAGGDSCSVSSVRKIKLPYDRNSVGIHFATLSFTEPSANRYAYKMQNIDEDWNYTTDNHGVSYANLAPGSYTFLVKGSNNDGLWQESPAMLQIEILPPWWRTIWAYLLYAVLIIVALSILIKWIKRSDLNKARQQQKLFEIEKEKELYRSKIDFFTQVAHEIRTPLTLINGPLESMLEMNIPDKDIRGNLKIMSRNTSELLTLINQLLDFRKIDNNRMALTFTTIDVQESLNDVFQRFKSMALSEGRRIELTLSDEPAYISGDRNAVVKIFNNLFSNAIKYSAYDISVKVAVEGDVVKIVFLNDGPQIPAELGEMVFEPFYQMKRNANEHASSGIGLSLSRSLAKMMNGSLEFSQSGQLNCFTVTLPILRDEQPPAIRAVDDNTAEGEDEVTEVDAAETILIVEDNRELRKFLVDKLCPRFSVEEASNGVEALDLLASRHVDLIISDIMMPEMNGLDLCKEVKSNIEYSHIPVLLLTAKNDLDSKVKGLKIGAEAYIEKPFSFKYLLAQITSIFENRRREKEAFRRKPLMFSRQAGMNKADEELLARIVSIVEENLTDPNFGVELLSEQTNMSRSSLHRKIKALSGSSPTDFIRLIKLKKAVEFISSGEYRVGEVCYLVGMSSPSYFIKQFQKQFGMTPKEFEFQCRAADENTKKGKPGKKDDKTKQN